MLGLLVVQDIRQFTGGVWIEALLQLVQAWEFSLGDPVLHVGAQWLLTVGPDSQREDADDPFAGCPGFQLLVNVGPDLLVHSVGQ